MPIMMSHYLQLDSAEPEHSEVIEGVSNVHVALGAFIATLTKGRAHALVVQRGTDVYFVYCNGHKYCIFSV